MASNNQNIGEVMNVLQMINTSGPVLRDGDELLVEYKDGGHSVLKINKNGDFTVEYRGVCAHLMRSNLERIGFKFVSLLAHVKPAYLVMQRKAQ